ncbi:MAG: PorV/PorQ family protein, partial [Aliifodinibius sp.]|nr:PorV/PorQ family protein [Fodinibius sp.]NIV12427.1 PorV/PorQ family protein [Fodinibius sp.]NIY26091.1 PorV/PorQ family protein [Fodinibius sp.]
MKKYIFVIVIILLSTSLVFSQDELSKVGTGMAQFLKLAVGGRGAALGDAYAAAANDVTALYWNPAGIQQIPNYAFGLSRYQLFADINLNFAGLVVPLGSNSRLGIHLIYLGSGDIEITTIEDPNGTGEFYNTSNTSVGLTFTRRLTERFSLGVTG